MDYSKLPKLSETKQTEPQAQQQPPPSPPPAALPMPMEGRSIAGGLLSIALGLLLLFMFPTTVQYVSSKVFHTQFAPFVDPATGQPANYVTYTDGSRIPYRQLVNFWSDLAVTGFAVVLLLEGVIVMGICNPWVVMGAFIITAAATAGNLVYLVVTYSSYGLAWVSALGVIFGAYILYFEASLLLRRHTARR